MGLQHKVLNLFSGCHSLSSGRQEHFLEKWLPFFLFFFFVIPHPMIFFPLIFRKSKREEGKEGERKTEKLQCEIDTLIGLSLARARVQACNPSRCP